MSYRSFFVALFLLAALAALSACGKKNSEVSEQQEAQQVAELFGNQCVNNLGHLERVKAWAGSRNLQEITNPDARKVYVGDAGGSAWIMKTNTNIMIVALREGTQECAVFGAHADPAAFADYFDQVVQVMAKPLGGPEAVKTPEPDKTEQSPYGQHIGKTRTLPLKDGHSITVAMFTFQNPGGAYQVSLQTAITSAPAPK